MKTINAFKCVKDFSLKVQRIRESLKDENILNQLKPAKEFFISFEVLNVIEAMKIVAESFALESEREDEEEVVEMFDSWHNSLMERADIFEELSEHFELFKQIIDVACLHYEGANRFSDIQVKSIKESFRDILMAVRVSTEDLIVLEKVIYIFENWVMPNMTEDELILEPEFKFTLN